MRLNRIFVALSHLRVVSRGLEVDLGIGVLSLVELDVLCAAVQLSTRRSIFTSPEMLDHPLVKAYGRTTVYRAIAKLEARGFLVVEPVGSTNHYSFKAEVD